MTSLAFFSLSSEQGNLQRLAQNCGTVALEGTSEQGLVAKRCVCGVVGSAEPVKPLLHWNFIALGAAVSTPGAFVILCWHKPFKYT